MLRTLRTQPFTQTFLQAPVCLGVARAAHGAGARVVVTARSTSKADAADQSIGEGATGRAVDLADEEGLRALFSGLDSLDHIMVTAGAQGRSSFTNTPPGEASAFMDAKLWANHRGVWEAREHIRSDGSIALLTGGYAQWATPEAAHVHVAFAATEALARSVAVSLAPLRWCGAGAMSAGVLSSSPRLSSATPPRASTAAGPVGRGVVGEHDDLHLGVRCLGGDPVLDRVSGVGRWSCSSGDLREVALDVVLEAAHDVISSRIDRSAHRRCERIVAAG